MGNRDPRSTTPDVLAARFAAAQHRLVTREQLLGAGVSDEQIKYRLRIERFHRQHPGVFSVGGAELDRHARWLAAVLACGKGAVLSHRSAAALWGLLAEPRGPVHVTVPGRSSSRRPGVVVHATRSLPAAETRRVRRIPTTSVERTLIDLAPDPKLERAVEQAYAQRLIGRTRIREALTRANGRRGTKELRSLFARLSSDLPLTRSELERRFLALVQRERLPRPRVNRHHATHRVDFAWPEHGLVVETDGRATHDNPYAFHQDRARDLDLELADLRVIRLSWWQVVYDADRIATLLRRRLS